MKVHIRFADLLPRRAAAIMGCKPCAEQIVRLATDLLY
jgi:hypothetical protein